MLRSVFFTCLFFISCGHPDSKYPHILVETALGDIEVELYPDKAPHTVAAFLANVQQGKYRNAAFYRVIKAEELPTDFNSGIIQGGVWQSTGEKAGPIAGIQHESTKQTGLTHTDGVISMARTGLGTASTEFFICIGDQTSLDAGNNANHDGQGYAAFGKVVKGMNIVRKIQNQPSRGQQFDKNIEIRDITQQ